jgi:hypothetical protein
MKGRGQAMAEFLIAFPLLVLLVLGLLQCALLYQVRATLDHAVLLAARAGALHNGSPASMRAALAAGLAPLFAAEPSLAGHAAAIARARRETAADLATLTVLNPTRAALADFGRARLDGIAGRELPADTLAYRNPAPGAASGLSVQDANLLQLRVRYCVRLIVPAIGPMIGAAVDAGGCAGPGLRGPRMPIQAEAVVRMQSPFYEANL